MSGIGVENAGLVLVVLLVVGVLCVVKTDAFHPSAYSCASSFFFPAASVRDSVN